MKGRWLAGLVALILTVAGAAVVSPPATGQAQRVTIEFWHGLGQPGGGILEGFATEFNNSQTQYRVNATYKGSYPETMVAAIAAFRAGNAPHIVQMFEVGTATMMAAKGAIKPVYELMKRPIHRSTRASTCRQSAATTARPTAR